MQEDRLSRTPAKDVFFRDFEEEDSYCSLVATISVSTQLGVWKTVCSASSTKLYLD